jgi:hypothetical protein
MPEDASRLEAVDVPEAADKLEAVDVPEAVGTREAGRTLMATECEAV